MIFSTGESPMIFSTGETPVENIVFTNFRIEFKMKNIINTFVLKKSHFRNLHTHKTCVCKIYEILYSFILQKSNSQKNIDVVS
jgi:hypothetical protein